MKTIIRTYSELIEFDTFLERFNYLKLNGQVGISTFGFDRYLNQILYNSYQWRRIKDKIVLRDNGCDLGIEGREIHSKILIHHMNPIDVEMVKRRDPIIFDPEYLIATTFKTHNAIHYGNEDGLYQEPINRTKNDTIPWRN